MRRTLWALTILLAACTGVTQSTTTNPPTTTSSTSPTTTLPPVVECPGAGEFGEGGGIAHVDGEGSDATRLGQISWNQSNQCESFTFEFETSEGAPATAVPSIRIGHLETFQILRIYFDIEATIVTDQLVETPLVDRLFVVRSLDGGMFVDLHLAAPVAARTRVDTSPALLTVDLRPGLVPMTGRATIGERVVLASPTSDAEVDSAANLIGYSRTFESNVLIWDRGEPGRSGPF